MAGGQLFGLALKLKTSQYSSLNLVFEMEWYIFLFDGV
jgi:hypothetical protein